MLCLPKNLLPKNLLPKNLLPLNARKLIREYSKPVTRPDWKTFKRTINPNLFIEQIIDMTILKGTPLFFKTHINMRDSTFYIIYIEIEYRGVDSYIDMFGGCRKTILSNRWLALKQKDYEII
jgi:hypothetical protein